MDLEDRLWSALKEGNHNRGSPSAGREFSVQDISVYLDTEVDLIESEDVYAIKKPLLHRKRDLEEAPQCPCLQGKALRGNQEWEASWVLREAGVGSVESGWAPRCSSISEVQTGWKESSLGAPRDYVSAQQDSPGKRSTGLM